MSILGNRIERINALEAMALDLNVDNPILWSDEIEVEGWREEPMNNETPIGGSISGRIVVNKKPKYAAIITQSEIKRAIWRVGYVQHEIITPTTVPDEHINAIRSSAMEMTTIASDDDFALFDETKADAYGDGANYRYKIVKIVISPTNSIIDIYVELIGVF